MQLPKTTFQFLIYFVRQRSIPFAILIAIVMAWSLSDAIFPYFLKLIINGLNTADANRDSVFTIIAKPFFSLVIVWIAAELLLICQAYMQIHIFPNFRANIRHRVLAYVESHSHEYFTTQLSGSISKRLMDLPQSCQIIMEIICFQFVTAGTGAIVIFVMTWFIQPIFALVLLAWIFLHVFLTIVLMHFGHPSAEKHAATVSLLNGRIMDALSNILSIRLFARSEYEFKKIAQYQKDEIRYSKKAVWRAELTRIVLGVNALFLVIGMVALLIIGWQKHQVSVGDFTQISMQTFWLTSWVWYVSYQMPLFARELGNITNALALIKKSHDLVDNKNATPIVISKGEIRFEQVKFSYRNNRKLFDNINVTIPGGQKVGLVGFSGSGKTSLVNLILRFYDVQNGRILIDDRDISLVTQNSLRSQISMIPQDPSLFNRTLMENIRYGRLNATDEEVIESAKKAHAHEFIEQLENGYQTNVGERGLKLSAGQRQRIAIARSFLKNAPILMLDEATSALDSVTEKHIQQSLIELSKGKTTLVIAHRLSTLAEMDRILVFHNGSIVEDGNITTLLEANGQFAKLWNLQMKNTSYEDHKTSNPPTEITPSTKK